ncbi:MarR family transcriptional regulator [uncultured Rothia sp.]|uniref:MarR family winged helix-turn-helix transcriptional regulator n=1 Tax=uncultured Rothia sp. TaxID=316088 RepID=UPI0032169E20
MEVKLLPRKLSVNYTELMDHVDRIQEQWHREMPEADLSGQSVVARVHRLANHLTHEITQTYKQFGLTEGEFDILCALRRQGAPFQARPATIAQTTMVTTGGTSKRLDRLETAGYIERITNPDGDGRSKIARLTPQGLDLINRAFNAHVDNEKRLVEELSISDRANLERVLKTWLTHFEKEEPHAHHS